MRIVIHDFGGYPFSAQLARCLATLHHDVTYVFRSGFLAPRAELARRSDDPPSFEMRGLDVVQPYRRRAGLRRLLQERRYGNLLAATIRDIRADVVVSANSPLDAQAMALEAAHGTGSAFVFWLQDVYSQAVGRLLARRLPVIGAAAGKRFAHLERRTLQRSDAIVVIADDFLPQMAAWDIGRDRVSVIENWAPLDEVVPGAPVTEWRVKHGVADRPVILYSGTLGRKHDPNVLIKLALALPQAWVVVVAEGVSAEALANQRKPANLVLLPLQPASEVTNVLASADVLIALLEADAQDFSIPSKVLTYLAAGRPVLGVMPRANIASRTIIAAEAGIVVEPGDDDGAVAAASSLLQDERARLRFGRSGRAWAELRFDVTDKARAFERVLLKALQNREVARHPVTRNEG
jgi:colanic acid biosynthesis glycosyl transferase WcaI